MTRPTPADARFEFGKNWQDFIRKNLSQERIDVSKAHLLTFMGRSDLNGLSFLDIGCGSGLHSIAALQAGAASVYSFDFDPDAVEAARYIHGQMGPFPHWSIQQGSVLDDAYLDGLPRFDVVYSWGVLHHTGAVWHALRNAAGRVKANGQLYVALYSADVQKDPPPEFWLAVKQRYVSAGPVVRFGMVLWYIWRFMMYRNWRNLGAFISRMRDQRRRRGMSVLTDIRDWLGGWPMEFVRDRDVIDFCNRLGFRLESIKTGEACSEFLFRCESEGM